MDKIIENGEVPDKVLQGLQLMRKREVKTSDGFYLYGRAEWVSVADFSEEEKGFFLLQWLGLGGSGFVIIVIVFV